ncbi:unnamed protein product [Symbiodinium pilosum]|uniref:Uncharacterized protein n=1 Tax=Symbiodinium pilosum TaxID=2952 RepID=A0A812XWN7_SYMPI|nr:unnamed protein product [Symbiodinium pilosum]
MEVELSKRSSQLTQNERAGGWENEDYDWECQAMGASSWSDVPTRETFLFRNEHEQSSTARGATGANDVDHARVAVATTAKTAKEKCLPVLQANQDVFSYLAYFTCVLAVYIDMCGKKVDTATELQATTKENLLKCYASCTRLDLAINALMIRGRNLKISKPKSKAAPPKAGGKGKKRPAANPKSAAGAVNNENLQRLATGSWLHYMNCKRSKSSQEDHDVDLEAVGSPPTTHTVPVYVHGDEGHTYCTRFLFTCVPAELYWNDATLDALNEWFNMSGDAPWRSGDEAPTPFKRQGSPLFVVPGLVDPLRALVDPAHTWHIGCLDI